MNKKIEVDVLILKIHTPLRKNTKIRYPKNHQKSKTLKLITINYGKHNIKYFFKKIYYI